MAKESRGLETLHKCSSIRGGATTMDVREQRNMVQVRRTLWASGRLVDESPTAKLSPPSWQ